MDKLFIRSLEIRKVRHLSNITIPLSDGQLKHLILTGKNGSGKTSVVEALAGYLDNLFNDGYFTDREQWLKNAKDQWDMAILDRKDEGESARLREKVSEYEKGFNQSRKGLDVRLNIDASYVFALKDDKHYIAAYYKADRIFHAEQPKHVEKVQLKDYYGLTEFPRSEFVKYLLDLKMTEALARNNNRTERANEIHVWFVEMEKLLKRVFDDETVKLEFDEDTFEFHILQQGKEPFDFNTLSSGYQAVLDIVLDIIMRMQNQTHRSFNFNLPGIVIIDEIETHLHLELQKNIMPLLTTVFPNIQWIVTTHSPFILNSIENVVIYDLENHTLVDHGLNDVPYDGVVEGYFRVDKLSDTLKEKFEKYKDLVAREKLSDDELSEIAELEQYLDEIPDYLAIGIATEYKRMKLEFMNREDIDG